MKFMLFFNVYDFFYELIFMNCIDKKTSHMSLYKPYRHHYNLCSHGGVIGITKCSIYG